jgi:hypothetical protein
MKQQKALIKLLYGYISFAFFMIWLNIFDVFRPVPDILAAISLLWACYYVGKYGNLSKSK